MAYGFYNDSKHQIFPKKDGKNVVLNLTTGFIWEGNLPFETYYIIYQNKVTWENRQLPEEWEKLVLSEKTCILRGYV